MINPRNKILALFLIASFLSCNNKNNGPSGLMIEFIREPEYTLIQDSKPEFSWIVPIEVKTQSSFQIQVASTQKKLRNDLIDVWDSGQIKDKNSVEIEYGGEDLDHNKSYFWRVRIWDENNNPTLYSKTQKFKTGNLNYYSTTKNRLQKKIIRPQKIIQTKKGHYFVDFGRDAFGSLLLTGIATNKESSLIVHLGERLEKENQVDRDPPGSIRYQEIVLNITPKKTDYNIPLKPNNRNTSGAAIRLPDSLGVVFPFRYCEIENCKFDLQKENILQIGYNYYFDDNQSSFQSSNSILNNVWQLCKYSIKATSFTGYYVDGDRERIPYEADAYINQLGHYYVDREYSMARITNEYFIKHPTWPTEWILHTVPMFYFDYLFTGNIESIRHYYKELKNKTLMSLAREDGLISSQKVTDEIMLSLGFSNPKIRIRDIVDWPPGQKDTGWKLARPEGERDGFEFGSINTVVNSFYYYNLKLISKLAGYLGKDGDSIIFLKQAEKVKKTINEKLFNLTKGIYKDGELSDHSSLHANMFPLAFGLVPKDRVKSVVDFIKSRGMACSVYGAQYLLEALFEAGEYKYATGLLTATNDRSWWNMISSGSSITTEAWDLKYKPNLDWNHAWGAAPANIIPRYLWGIKPVEPGYAKAEIKPQLGELKNSKVEVPTIRGTINAEYVEKEHMKIFNINIPGNMKADFVVADTDIDEILINGRSINNINHNFKLKPGKNEVLLKY